MQNDFNKKKIKIAVIGCGNIANKHFQALRQHSKKIKLVAVCGSDIYS